MVYMKNIQQKDNLVFFDAYINGDEDRHFTMTVDIDDTTKSKASIEKCYYTSEAQLKILYTLVEDGKLPEELVAMSH